MVILGKWGNIPLTISIKASGLTISLERNSEPEVYNFDNEGRLWNALMKGVTYRCGLDGKIIARWSVDTERHDRRWLIGEDAEEVSETGRKMAQELYYAIKEGQVEFITPLPSTVDDIFLTINSFDTDQRRAEIQRYQQIYLPVGILPPDQYMAVVLQATEGCSFNTCTFCTFYKGRPFHIKSPEEFLHHAQNVKQFLRKGLSVRRTIFLGDANALVIPMQKLVPLIEIVHDVYDVDQLGGIYAFMDGFSGDRKTEEDYRWLSQKGVKRVYIGMESGNGELLKLLKKPGTPKDVIHAVEAIKKGGLAVGLIILLGAGGKDYAKQHVKDTIKALNSMQLDMDDLIYFSELIESEGMSYVTDAYANRLHPLTSEERISQGEDIERALKFSRVGGTPHISRYDIREFVY
jgi:radical SAM superfamily enzyme YgiQ (UPF0313 family)